MDDVVVPNQNTENNSTEAKPEVPKEKKGGKKLLAVLLALLLAGAAAAGMWWWQGREISDLKKKNDDLQHEVEHLKGTNTDDHEADEDTTDTSSDPELTLETILSAIKSKDSAELKSYMNDEVSVIIAASEGMGTVSAEEAVTHLLQQLNNEQITCAVNPSGDDFTAWRANAFYGKYAGPTAVICYETPDGQVASIEFDMNGKIASIFTAASLDIVATE